MNNSSAYNNVLLKPAVQTQAAQLPSSVKPNHQDDSSYASFQQSFKDAHEQVRPQHDKVTKPAAKKSAHIDKPKPVNDVEKKTSTRPADESRVRDQVAAHDKAGSSDKTGSCDKAAEANDTPSNSDTKDSAYQDAPGQNASDQNSSDKRSSNTEEKPTAKKTEEDEESTTNVINTENLAALLQPQVALASSADAALVVADAIESGIMVVDAVTESASSVLATEVANSDVIVAASTDAAKNAAGVISTSSTTLGQTAGVIAGDLTMVDLTATAQAAVVDLRGQAAAPNAMPTATSDTAVVIAAAQTPLTYALEASDADVAASVLNVLGSETSALKTAVSVVASSTAMAAETDTATDSAPAKTLDMKSTFDKMMQNVTRPESGVSDDAQPAPAVPQAASSSSNTNSLDFMLRFSEAQTPAARSFVVQTAVPVPVSQPTWSQAVGEKVLWLAAQNVSSAEIHLNPENLGPMQVKVSVNQEHATVNFTSHHAVVREVLDQNLSRLRDMFSEQGLNLVNVDVSDKSFNRQQGETKEQKGQAGNNELATDEDVQATASAIVQKRLVDHYA